MKLVLLLLSFLAGCCVEARRSRLTTATATSTAASTNDDSANSNPETSLFMGDAENFGHQPWDSARLQKTEGRSNLWNMDFNSSLHELTNAISERQYQGQGELPNPISTPPALVDQPLRPGCLASRGQFPSATNCANYLNCWDDVQIEQTCPNGLLFNDRTFFCDFDYNVNCGGRPLPTPKPPLPPGSRICPDPNGRYRSSTNCSEFYICLIGRPIKFNCPRGLVYNDELGVCDYTHNVNCKGAATPKPQPPTTTPRTTTELMTSTETLVYPPYQPSQPSQPPYYPPQQPSQPTNQQTQPPYYPPQPNQPTQPPYYPPQPIQPTLPPNYPQLQNEPQPGYQSNLWFSKMDANPWQQRRVISQLEVNQDNEKQEIPETAEMSQDLPEVAAFQSPSNPLQTVSAALMKIPCANGDVHRLDDACSSVLVCRDGKPQLVRCSTGMIYDKPSDSCKPFSIAKC